MHALIVVAHHDPQSLTHSVATQVAAGLAAAGHTFEVADIAAESFDPRYTAGVMAGAILVAIVATLIPLLGRRNGSFDDIYDKK